MDVTYLVILLKLCLPSHSLSYPAVPQQLLSKIDQVISLADQDTIPTAKVSTLLDILSKAYKYGRSVSQDMFSMHETSVRALDNCDAAFKRFLSRRMIKEEDQAKEELGSCERFAGELIMECNCSHSHLSSSPYCGPLAFSLLLAFWLFLAKLLLAATGTALVP